MANQKTGEENKEEKRIEFNFPLLILRTKIFSGVFNKLGSFRASRLISWGALVIVPIVAAIGLFLIITSLVALLWNPVAGEFARELGPGAIILLPGITPYLPILYGWLAFIVAIVIHEGAHGVIARSLGLRVKSSGLLFLLFIPIGAFVDVDEEQIKRSRPKVSLRVMAAGVGGNIVVAIVCLLSLMVIVNGLTPVVDGVYIYDVMEGMPAEKAGLMKNDFIVSIDNIAIGKGTNLTQIIEGKAPGDLVEVTVLRGEMWTEEFSTIANLTESEGRTIMGIYSGNLATEERLANYKTLTPTTLSLYLFPPAIFPGLVPFSDFLAPFYTHELGSIWPALANALFWVWFVNINVAVFNALPIYPLDGGRIFNIALKSILGRRVGEKTIYRITIAVTAALICILVATAVIPFII